MTSPENPVDWIQVMAIGTLVVAAGTIVLAVVAIFGNSISRWLRRPKLKVKVDPNPPHCHKTYLTRRDTGEFIGDCYYFRILIENNGKTSAKEVEVYAKELLKQKKDGTYKAVSSFMPMNLVWSHVGCMLFPAIHRGSGKHCDVFHILDPSKRSSAPMEQDDRDDIPANKAILSFDTIVQAHTKGHLQPPGVYRLEVVVAAENSKAFSKTLFIETSGEWMDDEERMLSDGVGFGVI